ncbi:MAG: deoxyguanosinetriphosphate triphosphohydrolase [Fimbriimonadaceae bacterium]|nr:deoxyguanosinetriphosphate triphosphohydrolase [Fimbriimonadaceae bacterium]
MPHSLREQIEARERENLSPYAALSADSEGRVVPEEQDPVRTCFQRDRDRILHSKSFRRLKHKTQVFIDPTGDHYRTRLTHSLEVAQVGRTIGRALRLNEDLIEAIALGHDVGHTPFGHAGEAALDQALAELNAPDAPTSFRHYEQSLRVVDVLENLNLTQEVRSGIGGHSKGRNDLTAHDGVPTSTLEAAVVRVSDRIAYLNHDLDDAMRSGIIEQVPLAFLEIGDTHGRRIGAMVEDVILASLNSPHVKLSDPMLARLNDLKEWLFENVYLRYPILYPDIPKAQALVKDLFAHYTIPGNLPSGFEGIQGAIDYVAGMTDRFALATYTELKIPQVFAVNQ